MRTFFFCIKSIIRLVALAGIAYAIWKMVRYWHNGTAEKAGHTIDSVVIHAAEKLEKTASVLEKWAENGGAEHVGKDLDALLTDTKKTLENATDLIQHSLNHTR